MDKLSEQDINSFIKRAKNRKRQGLHSEGDLIVIAMDGKVAQLEAENKELWKLDKAVGEAFKDYPYENESGIKKMTLQSFAVIQRIRKDLKAGGE